MSGAMKLLISFIFFFVSSSMTLTFAFANEYFVGNGDVLAINVYENEDLSTTVRVTADNTIRVPLIGEVSVKDLTVSQVSKKLELLLADGYLVNPQVDVFMEDYRSKKATILGQIRNPGLFELQGEITLLEFISKAGGILLDAGSRATIKRKKPMKNEEDVITIDLDRLLMKGDTSLNFSIRDGDSVYIAKSDIFYVSGEVKKPDSYNLDSDMTTIKAITRAGGFSQIASKGKVRIIRTVNKKKQVLENVNMDEPILPNDVIVVPESFF